MPSPGKIDDVATPKVFTGARAIIKLNGDLMVFATDVSYSIETEYKPLREIDNSLPAELTPGQIAIQVVASGLRIPFGSPTMSRLAPTIMNAMTQPYCTIELRDRLTDATILYVAQAQMTRRGGRVSSRSMANETWTFVGIAWWDERKPAAAPTV